MAIDLLGQQHEEHLRARSRGAFLSDLADGRVEEADARRRAEALGFPGTGRGALLPVAASWRGARGVRRARRTELTVDAALRRAARRARRSTGFGVLLGPRDVDLLVLLALGGRGVRRGAGRARRRASSTASLERRGLGARRRGAGDRRAGRRLGGRRPGAAARAPLGGRGDRAAAAALVRRAPPRRHRPAARPARRAGARRVRRRAARPAAGRRLRARTRALLETLEAYLAAGGRKAQAARALHLERQSLYLRLHRIEELLGVSLDDEDAVLGLHLAVRALAFRRRRAAA